MRFTQHSRFKDLVLLEFFNRLISAGCLAAPQGGEVISGTGQINTLGTTTTINQTSPAMGIDWKTFNVSPGETVNFLQPSPSAVVVNRIFDVNGSQIMGRINSNGQVFLINPNGMVFGKDAFLNVGSLVASTLDVLPFYSVGSTLSFSGKGTGGLINLGTISTAPGGYVALLGNQVINQGVINAELGSVMLAAGNAVTLNFNGNSLLQIEVNQSIFKSLVDNGGLIKADGGRVSLSAGARDSLLASVVNNSGQIEARTLRNQAGVITLSGNMQNGTVKLAGTLDASALDQGDGGFIETSAAHVQIANDLRVDTHSKSGRFGTWLIDPQDYVVAATGGDISGATLSSNLETTSVSLQSMSGNSAGQGNVSINDVVAWHANTTLRITASNDVNINSNLIASGDTASLIINPNTGNATETASGFGQFKLGNGASVTLSGLSPSLVIAGMPYVVINQIGEAGSMTGSDLQGMQANLSGHYALGKDVDASSTTTWNSNAGFSPIGLQAPFIGIFDGLGHVIYQLTINRPSTAGVGLFGTADQGAVIRNVGLVGGSVKGAAGTGSLLGTAVLVFISNTYNTGAVTGEAGTGGLVGVLTTGDISNSYNTGQVIGEAGTGGLVGVFTTGNISNSYSTNTVTGAAGTGGLVGVITTGSMSGSFTTGNVTGAAGTGGLAGVMTTGNISDAYASGNVTGAAGTGGLVGGITTGFISNSFATGSVTGDAGTGGLAGTSATGSIVNSFAVSSSGAIDFKNWNFSDVWTRSASGMPILKALVKTISVTALNVNKTYDGLTYSGNNSVSYAGSGTSYLSGSLLYSGTYMDATNTGSYVITPGGLVSSNPQYLVSYINGVLNIAKANLTLSAVTGSKTYDGTMGSTGAVQVTGLATTDSLSGLSQSYLSKNVLGTNASTLQVNTGYLIQDGNAGGNYTVQSATAPGSITQRELSLIATGLNKTYDGNTVANVSYLDNRISGDVLNVRQAAATFADKNVGINKVIAISGINTTGTDAGNYKLLSTALVTTADINRLAAVAWTGGDAGYWFDAANWAGGAVPDFANVANVNIPANVNVVFNNNLVPLAQTGAVNVDNIASDGTLSLQGGTLSVKNDLFVNTLVQTAGVLKGNANIVVNQLVQTGGIISGSGNLSVAQSFSQIKPGEITINGNMLIEQKTGDLDVNYLSGNDISLTARSGSITLNVVKASGTLSLLSLSRITQSSIGSVIVAGTSEVISTEGDILLTNPQNNLDGLINLKGKNIDFTDATGPVITLNASGNSNLTAFGNISVNGNSNNLTITTLNGGNTIFGTITLGGNLVTNSAGEVSQTGTLAVTGTVSISAVGTDISTIKVDKLANNPTELPAIAYDSSANAASTSAIAAAGRAPVLTHQKDSSDVKIFNDIFNTKLIIMESDIAAEKILHTAMLAMNEADATADQVIVQAQLTKSAADATAAKVIKDAATATTTRASQNLRDINELTNEVGKIHNPFRTRAIAKNFAIRSVAAAQVAKNLVVQALQTADLVAQAAAANVLNTASIAHMVAKNVATKVLSDANSTLGGVNSQKGKLFVAAISAKVKVDIANAKLVNNSRQAKRLVDDAQIRVRSDALNATQLLQVSTSLSQAYMRNYVNDLILRNAALQ